MLEGLIGGLAVVLTWLAVAAIAGWALHKLNGLWRRRDQF